MPARFAPALVFVLLAAASPGTQRPPGPGSPPGRPVVVSGAVCAPLPPPRSRTVRVSNVADLVRAVDRAAPATTILVADGTYDLDGAYLRLDTPDVTLRSVSGNRDAVTLNGRYRTTEILQIAASGVTVADLTLREASDHPIHVTPDGARDTNNVLIYNVHIVDPGQQAIKINPVPGGGVTDRGVIACSRIELTDAGRGRVRDRCYTGGIDAHAARDWVIRDNRIEGFWCASGLSEHAIHLWRGSRDPVVERNVLRNNARGIGFGMASEGDGRVYADAACPGTSGYVDHYRGVIRNNVVSADDDRLFRSGEGADCGICLWNACDAQAAHNTVYTTNPARTFSAIEWRFANTRADIVHNLVNHAMRERDGARARQAGNVTNAPAGWFVNPAAGDLHLLLSAAGAIDRVAAPDSVRDDVDGQPRPIGRLSDVGADEAGRTSAPGAAGSRRFSPPR